ncbi:DNA replication licensing factor mcm5 [Lepeophtheirus salmonis]|uniref:DNA replication licensing factor MCM5 n=1 Tax=Lepeophtheirus salmonis TaxID=72036 RepID=A0A0K2U419_LEPSM|nr:DNA replication licensing factor mcm5-like [Lepeophtheirus salmonis]
MEGFDDGGVFFSDNFGGGNDASGSSTSNVAIKNQFKEFIRSYHEEGSNFSYKYRDALKRNLSLGEARLEVIFEDLSSFDANLADKLSKGPSDSLPLFEEAATELGVEILDDVRSGESVQISLFSSERPLGIRDLSSDLISRLVRIPGIIISASSIKSKAKTISIACRTCKHVIPNIRVPPGLEGLPLPRKCANSGLQAENKCPLDPYIILPDKIKCCDFQVLKLQESPDSVPHGEMPRHMTLFLDRFLVDKVVPGNKVTVLGIYSIRKTSNKWGESKSVGVRAPYLRVVGIQVDTDGQGRTAVDTRFTSEEEERFRRLAAKPNVQNIISQSIAPSIYGSDDIKKAIACLLFGGSRKRLPDGLTRRGDINVLLLGDPGTAKSQLLKFVHRLAPISVYTSGKGSSAAGLTASVLRDPATRNFVVEGGAMVLADGGVVCIDEFDKMREDDRVAIHEAMEQQTISIAKAGITTTLNSRCSVLAAANSIFGRWDDTKGEENIDFMPTILSRFDTIFIIKDEHNEARDTILAKHVISVHVNAFAVDSMQGDDDKDENDDNELSMLFLKKFITYARTRCGPRLSEASAEKLKNKYVMMRNGTKELENDSDKRLAIPITVRQLEAVIRISESLAKMELQPFAVDRHVDEALRIFQVSTLDAAMSGSLSGVEGFTTEEDQELVNRIERQLKRRFAIGSQVSEQSIIQDFSKQKYPEKAVQRVLHFMIRRGEIQHRMQRKMLYRIK